MMSEGCPHYYLPGGRVNLHEQAEDAVLREIKEELNIAANIVRPLWVNQAFFVDDVTNEKFHEICIYFLVDISGSDILSQGEEFSVVERNRRHTFRWIPFEQLKNTYFYPLFLKKEIFDLPKNLILRAEIE